jgi:hypothetical protein
MTSLFTRLRDRPLAHKAVALFCYGVLTFLAVYLVGNILLDNVVFFRVFEFLWFVHIVIVANQLRHGQSDFLVLALCGLIPGIINNIRNVFLV